MERGLLAGLGWNWHLGAKEAGLNLTEQGALPLGAQLSLELVVQNAVLKVPSTPARDGTVVLELGFSDGRLPPSPHLQLHPGP